MHCIARQRHSSAAQCKAQAGRYQANQVKHAPLVGHGKTSAGNERRYTRPHRRSNDEQLAAPARQSDAAHGTGKAPHGFTVHRHAIVSSLTQWHGAAQRTTAQAMHCKASQGTGNAPQSLTQYRQCTAKSHTVQAKRRLQRKVKAFQFNGSFSRLGRAYQR